MAQPLLTKHSIIFNWSVNSQSLLAIFQIDGDEEVNVTSYMCEYTQVDQSWTSTTQYCEIVLAPNSGYYKVEAAKIDITSIELYVDVSYIFLSQIFKFL